MDDASEDATAEVMQEVARQDRRVRAHSFTENAGLASARNYAIQNGTGRYFTFLDDDDSWDPGFLAACIREADRPEASSCIVTGFCTIGVNGVRQCYGSARTGPLKSFIEAGYTPPVAAQFYLREAVRAVGGYSDSIRSGVDHDLWLKLGAANESLTMLRLPLAFPDTRLSESARMTTNFVLRREKIAESLRQWRPLLEAHYSPGFTKHFARSYSYAISRKEIASLVASGNRRRALRLALAIPFKFHLMRFLRERANRSKEALAPVLPSFPPFRASRFVLP